MTEIRAQKDIYYDEDWASFKWRVACADMNFYGSYNWSTGSVHTPYKPEADETIIAEYVESSKWTTYVTGPNYAIRIGRQLSANKVNFGIGAKSEEIATPIIQRMRALYPEADIENDVWVNFWADSARGPQYRSRRLEVPKWSDIENNYPESVRDELAEVIAMKPSEGGLSGRLILWHGVPGTGKTYAIRALLEKWRKMSLNYILDPETFFNDPNYMLTALTSHRSNEDEHVVSDISTKPEDWALIILEDAGELLRADAREKVGQALSRLLNLTDGLVGQGLNFLILITTNEDLGRLHPAVRRPGRSLANVNFDPFGWEDANAWLEAHDAPALAHHGQRTLAELYARLRGDDDDGDSKIGF